MSDYFESTTIRRAFSTATTVVLDLNGLLVDDEGVQFAATNEGLRPYHYAITPQQWEEECVGRSASEYLPEFLPHLSSDDLSQILAAKDVSYRAQLKTRPTSLWKPGAAPFLAWLRAHVPHRALATSTHRANFAVLDDILDIRAKADFHCIVCGDDIQRAKPDPAIYLEVKRTLGLTEHYLVL
jgi:beta-phosphoglucomutase-like phosphatase (HAD superfamily)